MTGLVVRLSTFGSVAMLVPVLTSLATSHRNDTFVVLSCMPLADVFEQQPNVIYRTTERDIRSLLRTCRALREEFKFDYVVDLQDSWRSLILRKRLGSRAKVSVINKDRKRRKQLISKGYQYSEPLLTEFELYERAFAKIGLTANRDFQPLAPALGPELQRMIGEKYVGVEWVGLAPFAAQRTNMLPYKLTKSLLAYLSKRERTHVFLFGSGEIECEMLGQLATLYDHVTNVAGLLPIMDELALMRKLDIMVCMDSANQHLSSLVGLPALTIWCGTHPYAGFYGWHQPEDYIVQELLDCRPCTLHGAAKCKRGDFACQNIDSERIISKLESCLEKQRKKTK